MHDGMCFCEGCMDSADKIDEKAVRYDASAHAYYLAGKRLPSVGTILKKAATAFNPWAKDEIDDAARARMERGKSIHAAMDALDAGELDIPAWIAANAEHNPQRILDRYTAAKEELGILTWDKSEEPRHHKSGAYWGIIDRLKVNEGVWDLKSGSSSPSSYRVQVALYCMIWDERQGGIIHLEGDGPVIERITTQDFSDAETALDLAKRTKFR